MLSSSYRAAHKRRSDQLSKILLNATVVRLKRTVNVNSSLPIELKRYDRLRDVQILPFAAILDPVPSLVVDQLCVENSSGTRVCAK